MNHGVCRKEIEEGSVDVRKWYRARSFSSMMRSGYNVGF